MDDAACRSLIRVELFKSARYFFLRFLRASGGRSNVHILQDLLIATGHGLSHEDMRSLSTWMEAKAFITSSEFEGVAVYALTERGDDAARGLVQDDELAVYLE